MKNRKRYIYDPTQGKVVPYEERTIKESAGPHISKIYPFVTEDFDGKPTEVRSREHYRQLCKQHGVYAKHEFGIGHNISEI